MIVAGTVEKPKDGDNKDGAAGASTGAMPSTNSKVCGSEESCSDACGVDTFEDDADDTCSTSRWPSDVWDTEDGWVEGGGND